MRKLFYTALISMLLVSSHSVYAYFIELGGHIKPLAKVRGQAAEANAYIKNYITYVENRYSTDLTLVGIDITPTLSARYVNTLAIDDGVITVTFKSGSPVVSVLQGGQLIFTPTASTDVTDVIDDWSCSKSGISEYTSTRVTIDLFADFDNPYNECGT